MRKQLPTLVFFVACAVLAPILARAQQDDAAPSLGDVARKARLEKRQKDVQPKSTQVGSDAQPAAPGASGTQNSPAAAGAPNKDTSSKDAKPSTTADANSKNPPPLKAKKVITNEEIPEHVGPTHTAPSAAADEGDNETEAQGADGKAPPDYWRTRILSEKNAIAALKSDIDSLSASIQYAGGNCVSGCVQWNERQQQKQQQVDAMKTQLEQQQKTLEDMQEMARKQGYGSSVYDP